MAFVSAATDLVGQAVSGAGDVYVRDLATGTTSLVSVDRAGTGGGNGPSGGPAFSSDGRRVALTSAASNLGPSDASGVSDVYVRDLVAGSTSLASINAAGTGAGDAPSQNPSWAPHGSIDPDSLAFESRASDLISPADSGTAWDVYVLRVGGGGGNGDSRNPIHGGDVVVFESDASDLGATDGNGATAIYRRDLSETTTSLVSANPSGWRATAPRRGRSCRSTPRAPTAATGPRRCRASGSPPVGWPTTARRPTSVRPTPTASPTSTCATPASPTRSPPTARSARPATGPAG